MNTRKTWREKLEKPDGPRMVDNPWGRGPMVIPRPLDVDALIRQVPQGKLVTVNQLREKLAHRYGVPTACPLTTGIFVRIAAEAAEEDRAAGKTEITPYWRVVKDDGTLNPKFPGGAEAQAARLREEGHVVLEGKGKRPPKVEDVESQLQTL